MNFTALAIVGPTASGKTELGLRLAREQNGEIISVDSRQVYRYLSVGTAKPIGQWTSLQPSLRAERSNLSGDFHDRLLRQPPVQPGGPPRNDIYVVEGIPYHLVDIWDPAQPFSAADFLKLTKAKIEDIRGRGKKLILAGGTGLYFKALTEGLAPLPPASPAIRQELKTLAREKGRAFLHKALRRVDPEAAARIPANNIQRVIRALEVFKLTGRPISEWHKEHQQQMAPSPAPSPPKGARGNRVGTTNILNLKLRFIGINLLREELQRRIAERCRWMLENGLVEETESLLKKGYPSDCPAMTGLGYPRVVAYLKKQLSKEELLRLLTQDTRQYAKRQMTWFRHQLPVLWKKL